MEKYTMENTVSPANAARILGTSRQAVFYYIKKELLKPVSVDEKIRIPLDQVAKFVKPREKVGLRRVVADLTENFMSESERTHDADALDAVIGRYMRGVLSVVSKFTAQTLESDKEEVRK